MPHLLKTMPLLNKLIKSFKDSGHADLSARNARGGLDMSASHSGDALLHSRDELDFWAGYERWLDERNNDDR